MKYLISKWQLTCLCAALFFAITVFGGQSVIFPSVKYPDFPFSESVAYGGVLYLSGDIGTGSDGKLVEGGIGPESRQTMENIRATLHRHELDMNDIIKCTVFLADITEWSIFNGIYASYFEKGQYPARSAFATSGLALGARVEVECIAALHTDTK